MTPQLDGGRSSGLRAGDANRPAWRPGLRLWIEIAGHGSLGPGKLRLLEAIDRTHSLAAAARQLNMSYRLAWEHLQTLEKRLGQVIVRRQRGGPAGGSSELTPAGRQLLENYRLFEQQVRAAAEHAFERHFGPRQRKRGRPKG